MSLEYRELVTMKNQHTPGPWKHDEKWGLIKYGKTEICALHSGNEANADLIASAPDLLHALDLLLNKLNAHGIKNKHLVNAIEKAESAISKAKGNK